MDEKKLTFVKEKQDARDKSMKGLNRESF